MSTPPTKLQRWLDLIAFLVGRRLPVSYDDLMRGVPAYARDYAAAEDDGVAAETLRRKFERDKKELREHGIPIRTVHYSIDYGLHPVEGYQIERRDFYLPYLELVGGRTGELHTEKYSAHRPATVELPKEDAPLALDALRRVSEVPAFPLAADARSAFRKLAFDIDPDAFRAGPQVLFVEKPGAAELASRLRVLSEALLARKRVAFRYHGIYRDEVTERNVAPYGLLYQQGNWYLVGHDGLRAAIRIFRVGRMDALVPNAKRAGTADYQIPEDFSLDRYADREAWELGDPDEAPLTAHVRFSFPHSLWAERNGHGTLLERRQDGSQLRAFVLQQVSPFLRWVLSLEGEAEIEEPQALREEYRELARAVARAHGGQA